MLCYDGQLRNGSVATDFILLSSTATSSVTGGCVVVAERPSRNEEPIRSIEEQIMNVASSYLVLPRNLFNELKCILLVLEHEMLSYLMHLFHFNRTSVLNYFLNIFQLQKTFDLLFQNCFFIVGAGTNAPMSISDGSGPYIFCQKMEMTRPAKKEIEEKVFIFCQSRHFLFVDNILKVPFPTLYFVLASKQLFRAKDKV